MLGGQASCLLSNNLRCHYLCFASATQWLQPSFLDVACRQNLPCKFIVAVILGGVLHAPRGGVMRSASCDLRRQQKTRYYHLLFPLAEYVLILLGPHLVFNTLRHHFFDLYQRNQNFELCQRLQIQLSNSFRTKKKLNLVFNMLFVFLNKFL